MHQTHKRQYHRTKTVAVFLTTLVSTGLLAQAQSTNVDKLEQENQQLKQRLDKLENILKKEGITPNADAKDPPVAALTSVSISGFVTSSYFYDVASSKDSHPVGYLWNTALNQFTLNKFKLTLASPRWTKTNGTRLTACH